MAKLTEQEQQEVIRFIEADKPLPEKYRFLLFEDKREVEKNQVVFHDVSYIQVKPHVAKKTVAIELTDFPCSIRKIPLQTRRQPSKTRAAASWWRRDRS